MIPNQYWAVAGLLAACASPSEPALATAHEAATEPVNSAYWIYVSAESADEVYLVRFDGEQATVEKKIEVGYQPTEIEGPHGMTVSLDGKYWYLAMAHGKPFGTLYKYATGTDELVDQVQLGLFPATMEISPATGLLYCVNFDLHGDMSPSTVSIVDPDEMVEVARTTTGPMPHGSRISPDGLRHYSCSMMTGELFEIDAAKFRVLRVLDLNTNEAVPLKGAEPAEQMGGHAGHDEHAGHEGHAGHGASAKPTWVHPHPTRPLAYVALSGMDQVVEVDLESWKIVRRFATDKGPYNVVATPDGKKLVVSYKGAGAVGIWDIEKAVELARIPSTRKVTHGVVISPDSRYAFVSCEGIGGEQGTLDVFDLTENRFVTNAELGLQAGGITFWKSEPLDE
jgi:DNA-binding beta-propeller fold protein YncE